jgi:prolyl-tRNA synthetase
MTYTDGEGNLHHPIMGCYGIGVGRLAAAICEVHHDDYGPIWPLSIAPWQVHICAVRSDDVEVKAYADALYENLKSRGIEVIYDDRNVTAGIMFSDADLLGVPYRVVVSPRNLKQNIVEISSRDKSLKTSAPTESATEDIAKLVLDALNNI